MASKPADSLHQLRSRALLRCASIVALGAQQISVVTSVRNTATIWIITSSCVDQPQMSAAQRGSVEQERSSTVYEGFHFIYYFE